MVTPLRADGSLDVGRAAELADRLVGQGNDGLVISGTTGEAPTTSAAEKRELLRAVVDAVGARAHVLAGVSTNNTAESVELARDAAKSGATGLLAVTPYYSRPAQEGLIAHLQQIAEATDLPVMLYDIPGRTGTPLHTETLVQLSGHSSIVALKDAKDDLVATSQLLSSCDLAVYCGTDALNLPLLALGACGMVSVVSHVATAQLVEMISAYDGGDVARARQINRDLQPLYVGMFRTQGAILAKAALALQGFAVGPLRLPLIEATPEQSAVLRADLRAGGVLA